MVHGEQHDNDHYYVTNSEGIRSDCMRIIDIMTTAVTINRVVFVARNLEWKESSYALMKMIKRMMRVGYC